MIEHVENVSQFDEIISTHHLVLVDFFATWCGPCQMLSPVLEEIDEKGESEATIIKVDVDLDGNSVLNERYGIRSIPNLILFKDGEIVRTSLGYIPKNKVLEFIGA
ncbi:MAG: thioredoxin [Coprobacillus sp.]|nr:thioredoxin [Coprobacillus sp.]